MSSDLLQISKASVLQAPENLLWTYQMVLDKQNSNSWMSSTPLTLRIPLSPLGTLMMKVFQSNLVEESVKIKA